ncbi:ABC transporter permease [Shewanella inventionis]|uniref:ABC transporter n=1 Tax=Shewanella inventionis TaxID=1738770 RepID=A0ABQ1JBZ0_9GAMM|nr:ABC transporter permease [Shewanella inventionis]MCL1157976.1 ABC transporter permease [Shewanella inventionis]UAL44080.1 ABC transporter permease [Shewanella inventionis]GGB62642.1 ABC transporter [Shewanella inventionis]
MRQLFKRELNILWHSPWQLALISYIPLIGVLALWWLFSAGLPRQLPVALVDLDNSQISRMLSRQLLANSVIAPQSFANEAQAIEAMRQTQVYAMVVLPYQLKKDLLTGHQPTIDIRYNSQFLLVGKLLSSQLQLSLAEGLSHIGQQRLLLNGANKATVDVSLTPITNQTTALFNRNNNYVGFLVPPILIALWQLLAMLVFVNSLNKELILHQERYYLPHNIGALIATKILLYSPIMLLHSGFILLWLYHYLSLPAAGALIDLVLAQFAMLLALWTLVLVIFMAMRDSARTVSFCTALLAPAFAFMGITFPVNDMPLLAQWWRLVMPSSHYIDSHVSVISYGVDLPYVVAQMGSYWGFLLLVPVIVWLAHKAKQLPRNQLSTTISDQEASQ